MKKPMQSIDLNTKEKVEAHYERSDVCVVPAAGVIGEAVVALTIADAFLEKFGGDSMPEPERNYRSYIGSIAAWAASLAPMRKPTPRLFPTDRPWRSRTHFTRRLPLRL